MAKPRKFSVADLMLLVAAVAVGLWANRMDWRGIAILRESPQHPWLGPFLAILELVLPHLAALSAALLIVHLRRPRPTLRRLMRRPGAVACLTSCALMLIVAGLFVGDRLDGWLTGLDGGTTVRTIASRRPVAKWFLSYSFQVGFGVAVAWSTLLASGRWRPEPTWIDRLGRALGCLWIAIPIMPWFIRFLP